MGKYNVRKATGRSQILEQDKPQTVQQTTLAPVHRETEVSSNKSDNSIMSQLEMFDNVVTHNYLSKLSSYPIVPLIDSDKSRMGWYKITKIVYDGKTFFPDQLSMLYTSLHNVSKNVALVIQKNGFDDVEIYLGARDFEGNLHESSTLLSSAIQGYLPGVKIEQSVNCSFCSATSNSYVASYSGVASLRDDKKDSFVQGIEKFIDSTPNIPTYTALFVADNVSQEQVKEMLAAYSSLHDAIAPFTECQDSISETETEGVSETLTKTLGETITDSLSETVTRTEGTNSSYSKTEGVSEGTSKNKVPNIIKTLFGGETSGSNQSHNESNTAQSGSHTDFAQANQKSQAKSTSAQDSTAKGTTRGTTKGTTKQITRSNSTAKAYVDLLDRNMKRLRNGNPFGMWSIGTYFVSPDISTSRKLANIYRGCVTGEDSDLDNSAVNVWDQENSRKLLYYLQDTKNPRFLVGNINVSGGEIVSSKELAIHMSLPQTSIPGVEIRERAAFGRNICTRTSSNEKSANICIGKISHLGNISQKEVLLDSNEISKHIFVTGSTGSGKSNTVYLLVNELLEQNKNVLIVEPTKGDYRKVFGGRKDKKFTVYSTREDEKNLLKINPFAFPDGIRVVEHVERLVEIFGVCWPMYAAMPAVLKNSILSAYEECGWDLRKSTCKYGKLFPTIADVVTQLKRIISTSQYSADTKGDYVGALQTRLESLTNGIYSSIFSSNDIVSYESLYDSNVIIDLHNIGSAETRSMLMALVVLGLTEWRMSQNEDEMDKKLHHVTVLEEAHCILPRVSKQQSQEGSNVLGKSVEMIASAIAEMRTYGESFIIVDQSPSAVDEAAIRNTNTKIVMNLPDGEDREIAGKSIALTTDEQISELAKLSTGEALVWQRGWSEAVLASIYEMSHRDPLFSKDNKVEIIEDNANILSSHFINFFIKDKLIDEECCDILKQEILQANCPSSTKAKLIDAIQSKSSMQKMVLREAIITYLGIKEELTKLIDNYILGTFNLVSKLRMYMNEELNIKDSHTQNILLSISFIWASYQSEKWHSICRQNIEYLKNTK